MKTITYKDGDVKVEVLTIIYKIAMLMKEETLDVLKEVYEKSWTERAEFLFDKEYEEMNNFINSPSKEAFLGVIAYGNKLRDEIGMTKEEEQELTSYTGQVYHKFNDKKKDMLADLARQLIDAA